MITSLRIALLIVSLLLISRAVSTFNHTEVDSKIADKVKCEVPCGRTGKDSICIGTVVIGNEYTEDVEELTNEKRDYAQKHGYAFFVLHEATAFGDDVRGTHPALSKLPFAHWLLQSYPTVVILDADLAIVDDTQSIQDFIIYGPDNTVDMYMQRTSYGESDEMVLQSSAMIVHNTVQTRYALQEAWHTAQNSSEQYPGTSIVDFGEQTALQRVIESSELRLRVLPPEFCCLNGGLCEHHGSLFAHFIGSWIPGGVKKTHAEWRAKKIDNDTPRGAELGAHSNTAGL
jgi:hypothetical protein